VRDGKKILQQEVEIHEQSWVAPATTIDGTDIGGFKRGSYSKKLEWQDVPLVEEPKKAREFWVCKYNYNDTIRLRNTPTFHREEQCPDEIIHVREVIE
jgi:hypothetical protein